MASLLSRFKEAIIKKDWDSVLSVYVELNGDNDIKVAKNTKAPKAAKAQTGKLKSIKSAPADDFSIKHSKPEKNITLGKKITFIDDPNVGQEFIQKDRTDLQPKAARNVPKLAKAICSVCKKTEMVSPILATSVLFRCSRCQ